jgi:hypothetical protein
MNQSWYDDKPKAPMDAYVTEECIVAKRLIGSRVTNRVESMKGTVVAFSINTMANNDSQYMCLVLWDYGGFEECCFEDLKHIK